MINKINEYTHIRVSFETKSKLESKGIYGETMDDIISRLLFRNNHNKLDVEETNNDRVLKDKL